MPQNRDSGAEGNRFGREFGKRVATALGATNASASSNECDFNGERIVIHCARTKTGTVGVTRRMVEKLPAALGAFEQEDGSFLVYRLPMQSYRSHMKPSRSLGRSAGNVFVVERKVFEEQGSNVGVFRV
jgi:hypothetical protein